MRQEVFELRKRVGKWCQRASSPSLNCLLSVARELVRLRCLLVSSGSLHDRHFVIRCFLGSLFQSKIKIGFPPERAQITDSGERWLVGHENKLSAHTSGAADHFLARCNPFVLCMPSAWAVSSSSPIRFTYPESWHIKLRACGCSKYETKRGASQVITAPVLRQPLDCPDHQNDPGIYLTWSVDAT